MVALLAYFKHLVTYKTGVTLKWFTSFLKDRNQSVELPIVDKWNKFYLMLNHKYKPFNVECEYRKAVF